MSWDAAILGYAFSYDGLSRLTTANYLSNGTVYNGGGYSMQNVTYDKHGNMKTMQLYGRKQDWTLGLVDNLTMTYTGNQLTKAEDAIATISRSESNDFKNYSNVATEYAYNKNGAMNKDLNKGITSIQYNSLNLPRMMDIKSPLAEARNEYLYSAGGVKLKVTQKWNPNFSTAPVIGSVITVSALTQTKTTDYVGNKVYEDGVLKRILVDGGYIEGGVYYFNLNDHLGNNRVVANTSGTAIQKNHYYPFGMAFAETPLAEQQKQPYKYNGKELDQMHGLNLYDYSARQYDPAIGRFPTVDPLAESYYSWSPYIYCLDNPLKYVDPDGKDVINAFAEELKKAKQAAEEAKRAAEAAKSDFGEKSKEFKAANNLFKKADKQLGSVQKDYDKTQAHIDEFKKVDPEKFNELDNLTYKDKSGATHTLDVLVKVDKLNEGVRNGQTVFDFNPRTGSLEGNVLHVTIGNGVPIDIGAMSHEGGHSSAIAENPAIQAAAFLKTGAGHDCQDPKNRNHILSKRAMDWQSRYTQRKFGIGK
ncbi:MAG: hypothetical protein LBV43_07935 [Prevotella sp.]|jgi:RHS repeat-associated protein|nr:hypothetical protein [Prevotella sp.]